MEMTGEQLIPASQQDTWKALNDPEILKACIPGCESIDSTGENEYSVLMVARVGPVSAKFKGKLSLSDIRPPTSYAMAFEGQGGPAGFAKGGAHVSLSTEGNQTRLRYEAKASIGGKLAQIGSRLIDAAAKKVSDDFFRAFNEKVASGAGGHGHDDHEPDEPGHGGHDDSHGDEHHAAPVPRDPDLPAISDTTLRFFAAGALVVSLVSLTTLFG
jgi:carbon monoxide dehydrogenase subunit G